MGGGGHRTSQDIRAHILQQDLQWGFREVGEGGERKTSHKTGAQVELFGLKGGGTKLPII